MGEVTAAARAEVLTARAAVETELERLEAAARAAVDVKAKIRRHPVRTAGAAAGAGFLLLGGPRRLFRGAKRAILGPTAMLPKSMLPGEIDKALRELGEDGEKVRGTLEREFAAYLDAKAPERRERELGGVLTAMFGSIGQPVAKRLGRQLAGQLFAADGPTFAEQLAKVRERRTAQTGTSPATTPAGDGAPAGTARTG